MEMRNSIQANLTITTALSLTPQMMETIRLMPLSCVELEQEIQHRIDENPFLEKDGQVDLFESIEDLSSQSQKDAVSQTEDGEGSDYSLNGFSGLESPEEAGIAGSSALIQKDNNYVSANYTGRNRSNFAFDKEGLYEGETSESLRDHLLFQLEMSPLRGTDKRIAELIIDAVNESGYLTESSEDLLLAVQKEEPETSMDEVLSVLKLVQHYDPLGVASRDVKECLLIQLNNLKEISAHKTLAVKILTNYSEFLEKHDYRALCHKLSVKECDLKEAIKLLQSLNPRPGNEFSSEKEDFIIPDVIVIKGSDGKYVTVLNDKVNSSVKLNEYYSQLVNRAQTIREKEFFRANLKEAKWFIASVKDRNDTLLKVSQYIADYQKAFMESGTEEMKPMIMKDVAEKIGIHESSVSRITTNKYIYTPQGTFELKYFFSSAVKSDDGEAASSTSVKALIANLITGEDKAKPLSDSQITALLQEKGLDIARRTIAKYREELGFASSSQRKTLM